MKTKTARSASNPRNVLTEAYASGAADERSRLVRWLTKESETCDCFAREEGECVCGAWGGYKQVPISAIIAAIKSGVHVL